MWNNSTENLRQELRDHVGSAWISIPMPMLSAYLAEIDTADERQLLNIAADLGLIKYSKR